MCKKMLGTADLCDEEVSVDFKTASLLFCDCCSVFGIRASLSHAKHLQTGSLFFQYLGKQTCIHSTMYLLMSSHQHPIYSDRLACAHTPASRWCDCGGHGRVRAITEPHFMLDFCFLRPNIALSVFIRLLFMFSSSYCTFVTSVFLLWHYLQTLSL